MILNCPECSTRYTVPDAAIGTDGRTVRCTNCGHSWHVASLEAPIIPAVAAALPPEPTAEPALRKRPRLPSVSLPNVIVIHRAPRWLEALCAVMVIVVLLLTPFAYRKSIMQRHPELAFVFEPFGIYYTDGLALADVDIVKTPLANKKIRMTINCSVINESKGSRILPLVNVTLLDSDGTTLAKSPNLVETGKNMISNSQESCKPFIFETTEDEVSHARIDLADPFDLALRNK